MTSFQLSAPSKTFLLGEYVVLRGGPGIVLTTAPRFSLLAKSQIQNKIEVLGIDLRSPAGKLIQQESDFYKKFNVEFVDSLNGLGAFGASGAPSLLISEPMEHLHVKGLPNNEL